MELRLSEQEALTLAQKSEKAHLSHSEFVRRLITDSTVHEAPPVDYFTLITELRRVGSNVNQLLKVAYTNNFIDTPLLKKTLEDYHNAERMIYEAFGEVKQ